MTIDPWLPRGFSPSAGLVLQRCAVADDGWQIYDTLASGRLLVVHGALAKRWIADQLLSTGQLPTFEFGSSRFAYVIGGRGYRLEPVESAETPEDFSECQAFVAAISRTRETGVDAGLHDALYVERLSRLFPCYSPAPKTDDAIVAGYWISGGVKLSLTSTRRMRSLAPWLSKDQLSSLVSIVSPLLPETDLDSDEAAVIAAPGVSARDSDEAFPVREFSLPGRPALEAFFNEHVIDLIRNEERYKALGISFPGAVLLHGPPGCGKTFAVEKLVDYLDWPCFSIDSGSIGSPYIHETEKRLRDFRAGVKSVARHCRHRRDRCFPGGA